MEDKQFTGVLRKRIIRGLIQAIFLFAVFFGFSFIQDSQAGEIAFSRAAVFSLLIAFGYSLNRVFHDLEKIRRGWKHQPAGTAAGMLIAAIGFWQSMVSFNEFRLWPGRLALILLCGVIGYALSRLAEYRGKREGGLWWGLLGWLQDKPAIKFLFGILLGLYLVYLRPYMGIDPNTQIILEWFLFCFITVVLLFRIWSGAEKKGVKVIPGDRWARHAPNIERLVGTTHEALIRVERQFYNMGEPSAFYVLLTILLDGNGVGEKDIADILEPLMNFKGINQARQSGLILSRRAEKQQKAMRQAETGKAFANITGIGNLNRVNSRSKNRMKPAFVSTDRSAEEMTLDELKNRYLKQGDKSGLVTRIILTMNRSGRYHEHIVSALRRLTDDSGNPSEFGTKTLLTDLRLEAEERV